MIEVGAVQRPWHAAASGVVAVNMIFLTGCAGSGSAEEPRELMATRSTAPPAATPPETTRPGSEAEAQAAEAALAVYRSYWNAVVEASKVPDPSHPDLEKYAADKALANEQSTLFQLEREGIVYTGEPTLSPKVASVELGTSPVVIIADCVDSTNWQPVHRDTGEPAAAPGQAARVPNTAEARPYRDGWVITNSTADRSRTC
jgi:hypothetical protein